MDLVVLDLMLPGVGGEAVLSAIRDRGDTPVLIASAKRSDEERIAGLRMGADDYLAKPYNPHELTARVAAVLRRSRGGRTGGGLGPGELGPDGPDVNEDALSFDGGRLVVDPASRRYTVSAPERARASAQDLTRHSPTAASHPANSACWPPSRADRAPS